MRYQSPPIIWEKTITLEALTEHVRDIDEFPGLLIHNDHGVQAMIVVCSIHPTTYTTQMWPHSSARLGPHRNLVLVQGATLEHALHTLNNLTPYGLSTLK